MRNQRGFTLLELLMVVIIIAILASIALPQYMRVAERSRASEALTVIAAIRSSELRFKAQDPAGAYEPNLANIDIEVPGIGATPLSTMWTYTVNGAAGGSNAVASRITGTQAGQTVEVDIDSGNTCTSAAPVYNLKAGPC